MVELSGEDLNWFLVNMDTGIQSLLLLASGIQQSRKDAMDVETQKNQDGWFPPTSLSYSPRVGRWKGSGEQARFKSPGSGCRYIGSVSRRSRLS